MTYFHKKEHLRKLSKISLRDQSFRLDNDLLQIEQQILSRV